MPEIRYYRFFLSERVNILAETGNFKQLVIGLINDFQVCNVGCVIIP
jgi:hypothetical protein